MHQTENFVEHLILWHNMDETEREELKGAYRREKDLRVVEHMITLPTHLVWRTDPSHCMVKET